MSISLANFDPKVLERSSREDLIQLAKDMELLIKKAGTVGPQTPEELHALIKEKWKVHIPRVAVDVDRGHCAPFDLIVDAFFERETACLVVAGRDSGKTFGVQIIHALNARFKPGYEGISAGAVEQQSKTAYSALKKLNAMWGSDVKSTQESETLYENASKVYILGGTPSQLNGPHSNLLHRDEIELFRQDSMNEANNITRTGMTTDGRQIKAIDILTSSLKFAKGPLQALLQQVDDAVRAGGKPPYKVYKWGVSETIAPVQNCRWDPKNADLPEDELCPCHEHINGVWDERKDENGKPTPRTLESVCNGRWYKSDGYRPLVPDIVNKFDLNSRSVWEAQQECIRPAADGLILANFQRATHVIKDYKPDPEWGMIFNSSDFGGTNAHASNWYQLVNQPVIAKSFANEDITIPAGSIVAFDEVYVSEVGNIAFGSMVLATETKWKHMFPFFEIEERYADIAAKSARLDWVSHPEGDLSTIWYITREIEEHIQLAILMVDNNRFFVDERCEMFIEEAEAWQRDEKTGKPLDKFNHAMSGFRYAIAHISKKMLWMNSIGSGIGPSSSTTNDPAVARDGARDMTKAPSTGPASRTLGEDPYGIPMHSGGASTPTGRIW